MDLNSYAETTVLADFQFTKTLSILIPRLGWNKSGSPHPDVFPLCFHEIWGAFSQPVITCPGSGLLQWLLNLPCLQQLWKLMGVLSMNKVTKISHHYLSTKLYILFSCVFLTPRRLRARYPRTQAMCTRLGSKANGTRCWILHNASNKLMWLLLAMYQSGLWRALEMCWIFLEMTVLSGPPLHTYKRKVYRWICTLACSTINCLLACCLATKHWAKCGDDNTLVVPRWNSTCPYSSCYSHYNYT